MHIKTCKESNEVLMSHPWVLLSHPVVKLRRTIDFYFFEIK